MIFLNSDPVTESPPRTLTSPHAVLEARSLNAWFGAFHAVKNINLGFTENQVTALMGPSGCGKSTFLRCLNRLHEEIEDAQARGEVIFNGKNIYGPGQDPVRIRRGIGMVFQKANPFPSMSIYDNVAAGLKLMGIRKKNILDEVVESNLRAVALWDEVKDKLREQGTSLSGGQQQRLCIARALTAQPKVLLMDEPTSALDPISTEKIEELMSSLKKRVTIVIVTHNLQQAVRIADRTAFFLMGELIETGETQSLFHHPQKEQTARYIAGRFG